MDINTLVLGAYNSAFKCECHAYLGLFICRCLSSTTNMEISEN